MNKELKVKAIEALKSNVIGHKNGKEILCETCPTYALIVKGEHIRCDCDYTTIKKK